jgi:tetratricopeptide (TPR) repeat protein
MHIIAQDGFTWIGQKVVAKYHYPIERRDQTALKQKNFHVYTAERVEGERLWVTSGSVEGWIPLREVLLFDEAIDFYTQEIGANPGESAAWCERGIIFGNKKGSDKAVADFNEAIRLDPANAIAYGSRGIVWAAKEEYEKAFADFDASIRHDPTIAAAYAQRGYLWMARGEYDKAIADYDEALRLDPEATSTYC